MLQIANLEELTEKDIPRLVNKIQPILDKRRALHDRYSRLADDSTLLWSKNNEKTKITFEKFLTDLATGYTSGTPIYSVEDNDDDEKKALIKKLLNKDIGEKDYKESMEILIQYITNFNDDAEQNYQMFHNIFELTSTYQVLYEDENNELRYVTYDPLQTVAVWGYELPIEDHLIGLVRIWDEETLSSGLIKKVEITDKNGTRTYSMNDRKEVSEDDNQNHNWGDVPAIAVETGFAIFEPCEDIIRAYEQLVQNVRNIYQYNDDAILKVTGYTPVNQPVIRDDNDNLINNPAYQQEVEFIKKMGIFFTPDGSGDIDWVIKQIDANGISTVLKLYVDMIFQIAGIPNTSDLAFNSTDLNASAIDRKFYIMNMATTKAVALLKKAYLRRWELIFGRINLKNRTKFDFRDIKIELPKNLPANDDERIDSVLKLKDVISDQTIIEKLGYNYNSEKAKMDKEAEENFENNMNNVMGFKNQNNDEQAENPERGEVKDDNTKDMVNNNDNIDDNINNNTDDNIQKPKKDNKK